MRPAMDEQGKGWRLRAARAELGLSEEALANELRRWAELRGEPRPDITADTIAEWQRKHADVTRRLADAEEAWLKAQETFDRASA